MRTRASMGKMVNKLTKRELQESFAIIDRIARGSSQPYTRDFVPQIVAMNNNPAHINTLPAVAQHENAFQIKEQTADNVIVMRSNSQRSRSVNASPIIFPDAFYEYFEVIDNTPSKVG
ncbi:MAG: hypothetical protein ACI9TY_000295 [Alphaproteobacteria bacterium]|jgi:hypothetical protein